MSQRRSRGPDLQALEDEGISVLSKRLGRIAP
jgi:hypothetical protein